MDNMIDVTAAPVIDIVKASYELSTPQGLGFLHARSGGLSDEDAQEIIDREGPDSHIAASMDYVHGRAVKLTIFKEDGKRFIPSNWFDHSDRQLSELLERVGIST